ncbi:MAG: hypothetical protein LBI34_00250 [Puniceicoccales bacterium]|jgi:hypothetical protein|nr:hypothetical protein [Puniceicoccales bacterium]
MIRRSFWGLIIVLSCFLVAPISGKPLTIDDVYLVRHAEGDFRRLSTRFHARPPTFPFTILRTDPDQSEGVYFIVSMNRRMKNLPQNAEINLRYLVGGNPVMYEFRLPVINPMPNSKEIWVGLTAPDQRNREPRNFHAWAIDVLCDSEILMTKRSFLFREK